MSNFSFFFPQITKNHSSQSPSPPGCMDPLCFYLIIIMKRFSKRLLIYTSLKSLKEKILTFQKKFPSGIISVTWKKLVNTITGRKQRRRIRRRRKQVKAAVKAKTEELQGKRNTDVQVGFVKQIIQVSNVHFLKIVVGGGGGFKSHSLYLIDLGELCILNVITPKKCH